MSQIVYSAQKSGFKPNRIYQNPRFFDGVLQPGATSVVIVGDWPAVEAAYKEAGIPVATTNDPNNLPNPEGGPDAVSQEVNTDHPDSTVVGKGRNVGDIDPPLKEGRNVEVPKNLEELSFRDLKALAVKLNAGQPAEKIVTDFASKREVIDYLEGIRKGE